MKSAIYWKIVTTLLGFLVQILQILIKKTIKNPEGVDS